MQAKDISLIGQIVSAVLALAYNVYVIITTKHIPSVDEQMSILLCCTFMGVVCFSPVSVSVWIEKILGKKP